MASVSDPWVAVRMECTARVGRGLAARVAGLYIAVWWSKRRGPEGAASRTVYRCGGRIGVGTVRLAMALAVPSCQPPPGGAEGSRGRARQCSLYARAVSFCCTRRRPVGSSAREAGRRDPSQCAMSAERRRPSL